ncbi:MAG TPA: adenylate/guanylate cyclase domain-containing protein [Candidatus Mcinerneyibacteriales bacterium]|nr:adenylate/guanylate cyclase domain-containing protein [Candidatus Mcinerneyibacteriales bacterium]HPE20223.1 adenylate/guanylate cyclase domain-containing protein [Candidatus Mcinerneyibacteriales bacterium]HPJ69512.1 adenylate/guanylate cyclase domain-containing protein [Candidatus Mcinerneyibacteriales bacterium]
MNIFDVIAPVRIDESEKPSYFKQPLPGFPDPVMRGGIATYPVYLDARLRVAMERLIEHLFRSYQDEKYRFRFEFRSVKRNDGDLSSVQEYDYRRELYKALENILHFDDRGMYLNLFFVALSTAFAVTVKRHYAKEDTVWLINNIVYDIHRQVLAKALKAFELKFSFLYKNNFLHMNRELVEFIIRDQLAFFASGTETNPEDFLFPQSSSRINSRFLISREAYRAIRELMTRTMAVMSRQARYESLYLRKGISKKDIETGNVDNLRVLTFLLRNDYLLAQLLKSSCLKAEQDKLQLSLQEILYLYEDIVKARKRFLILSLIRKKIYLVEGSRDVEKLSEEFQKGELFWFSENHKVHLQIVPAAIFFLDIRNFSQRSKFLHPDETIRQLHLIFDPIPEVFGQFTGYVDKILGDGVMGVFKEGADPRAYALAAIRSGIMIFEHFLSVRRETDFEDIGIGIHLGNVSMAQLGQLTPIGETVNMAARLSSSQKSSPENVSGGMDVVHGATYVIEEKLGRGGRTGDGLNRRVYVSGSGELFNRGIAVSGDVFDALKDYCPMETIAVNDAYCYLTYDSVIQRNIIFLMAGRAELKGFGKQRVFEVLWDQDSVALVKKNGRTDRMGSLLKEWMKKGEHGS